MPIYTFINVESGMEYDETMPMSEYDEYMEKNPNIQRVWHGHAPALVGDHMMGVGPKVDSGFNDNMSRIADAHPGSPMADRYGSSTTKDTQTRKVLKKHNAI